MASNTPENWIWPSEPVPAGPCVVIDVDGVISNAWHRQHFLDGLQKDWKGFFAAAGDDEPIPEGVALLEQFDSKLAVVLLTARPYRLRDLTVEWLARHKIRHDLLVLRGRSDGHTSSPEFKRRAIGALRDFGFVPQLCVDDDVRNVEMFRSAEIPALYMHSGYYEA